jgi:hypothetical protein
MSSFPTEAIFARFSAKAFAEPGVFARVIEIFAKRNIVPGRISSERRGDWLFIEIEASELSQAAAERIAASIGVESVEVSNLDLRKTA